MDSTSGSGKSSEVEPRTQVNEPLPLIGVIIGNIRVMEKKMETTIVSWSI